MIPVKYLVCCIVSFYSLQAVCAQGKNKMPAGVTSLFDNLPIDNAAQNSILLPGEDSTQKIKKNIFLTGTVSKNHCFLGEPVLLTYTLYSSLQSTSTIYKAPSFAGFSVTAMETDNEHVKRKVQDGKNYRVFIVQQVQLTPLQEGLLTIEPIAVYNQVTYKTDQKEMHYGGIADGRAMSISVDPLPVANRPAVFQGAVGHFSLQALADTALAAGENDTLHIEIAGTGNFNAVSMPEIAWPAGCEHFTVNSRLQLNENSFPLSGKKIFDIPFVPSKEGLLVIPALQFSFFEPQKKNYQLVYSNPVTVHVSAAIHKSGPQNISPLPPKNKPYYYWLVPALFIPILIAFVFYRRKKKLVNKIAANPPEMAAVPKETERIDIEVQLATLSSLSVSYEYIAEFKKILTSRLQEYAGAATDETEESLLQLVKMKDSVLATAAEDLYAQCNQLLYAPASLNDELKKEMENRLVLVSKKADKDIV